MEILNFANEHILNAGLTDLWNTVLKNWITPLYIAMLAVFAIMFLKDRSWTKLIGFVGIAAVVGVLVFAGGDIFASKDKGLTKVAKDATGKVNTAVVPDLNNTVDNGAIDFNSIETPLSH